MATKTALDVITETLVTMNYVAPDEAPASHDYATALKHYRVFHEWLRKEFERDIRWSWDSVDETVWTYVSGWFAGRLCRVMATSQADRMRVDECAQQSERALREMLARRTLKTTEASYY